MPKYTLLWISDNPRIPYIGQSIVTREILNRFDMNQWSITVLGYGEDIPNPVTIGYPVREVGRTIMSEVDKLAAHIAEVGPDVVVLSHDIYMWPTILQIREKFPNIKFVGYVTVDGVPIFSGWRHLFYGYDLLISPTRWGRDRIKDQWLDLDVEVVPYGLDHKVYRPPTNGKRALKEGIQNGSEQNTGNKPFAVADKFVACYVGANQSRKNLGASVYGWKKFAEGKDDVQFFLITHSSTLKAYTGHYFLGPFAEQIPSMEIIPNDIPQEWLLRFIGMSDVLLHPALGEGFGLTLPEAMACGTIPITTDYSGQTDFCNDRNSYIVKWHPFVGEFNVIRAIAEHDDVTRALQQAYDEWKSGAIEARRQAAIQMAGTFSWEQTAADMSRSLLHLVERNESKLILKHIM